MALAQPVAATTINLDDEISDDSVPIDSYPTDSLLESIYLDENNGTITTVTIDLALSVEGDKTEFISAWYTRLTPEPETPGMR